MVFFAKDIHRLIRSKARLLKIGGIEIKHKYAIKAHSDGDLIFHVLTSCLLASMNMPTLGQHFSDKDPINKNRSSFDFLQFALNEFNKQAKKINNIDLTIICEKILLANYLDQITLNLKKIFQIDQITIKASRYEKKHCKYIEAYCLISIE